MRRQAKKFAKGSPSDGSALILTVVLTSLLAMVGVLFVMMARVNQIATSGISESKELDSAIETVIAKISDELVLDVPHNDPCRLREEYYDYPDVNNAWLASLEPYEKSATVYKWRQITDLTGFLGSKGFAARYVKVDPQPGLGLPFNQDFIREYPEIKLDNNGELDKGNSDDGEFNNEWRGQLADADGDGIADAKWVELDDITSSKGRPIYAAIRIIDNGGMINVNTAYKFDPTEGRERIDGSSQMQINLEALARAGDTIGEIDDARNPDNKPLLDYQDEFIWRIEDPCSDYIPFDISDEIELRNRFFLTSLAKTRLEATWNSTIGSETFKRVPYDSNMADWFGKFDPNLPSKPDRRHYLTTHNMDRIIDPSGNKLLNINTVSAADYNTIKEAFTDSNFADANGVAAQITANLIDYVDGPNYPTSDPRYDPDNNITVVYDDANIPYYGFERPCVYISELAHKFVEDAADPSIIYRSYAIELHKPYSQDDDPNGWRLVIGGSPIGITNWLGGEQFCVILNEDPCALLTPIIDSNAAVQNSNALTFDVNIILLQRPVDVNYITVDSKPVPDANGGWLAEDGIARSIQRDIARHKCIRRLWDPNSRPPTLGRVNDYNNGDLNYIQAHPANEDFTNIGEIGMVFRKSAYSEGPNAIGPLDSEATARINLAESCYQSLFQYLTVFDPAGDGIDNDGDETPDEWSSPPIAGDELKVPGRININTAPWFVLAQLPWVSQREGSYNNTALAEAIVAYRDKTKAPGGDPNYSGRSGAAGFENIGQLCDVNDGSNSNFGIDYYSRDDAIGDQTEFPDLTPADEAADDFEERDLIFARISNLVTVRSDVFTAYILVRIGTDGPQKRVIAILDRSDVYSPTDRVKIVAVHPVADPR